MMRIALSGPDDPAIAIRCEALELLPDDQRAWVREWLGAAEVLDDVTTTTVTGWPLRLVLARAGDEYRLAAFYAVFEHGAAVLARCAAVEPLEALRATLRAPRLVVSDEVAALAELFDVQRACT